MDIGTFLKRPDFMLIGGAVVVIIIAIGISGWMQGGSDGGFSKVLTYGPVWNQTNWKCTSDKDFVIHAVLRGLANGELAIRVSNLGTQSLYDFSPGEIESFSIGAIGGETVSLIREGTVSGWLTLQTMDGAKASCTNG